MALLLSLLQQALALLLHRCSLLLLLLHCKVPTCCRLSLLLAVLSLCCTNVAAAAFDS
jgi:hypothetical protein